MAVPVKPFGVAKRRLAPLLDAATRSHLGRAIALRTLRAAADAGGQVAVVTGDPGVARWARAQGMPVIEESPLLGSGLDGAARAAVAEAHSLGLSWAIVHADLPLIRPQELQDVYQWLARSGMVLAPSRDGGTNVVAGSVTDFPFAYGPGSFTRHMVRSVRLTGRAPTVIVRTGLALDLDGPQDLRSLRSHPRGAWIERHVSQDAQDQ